MTVRLVWLLIFLVGAAFWLVFAIGARTLIQGEECAHGQTSAVGPVSVVDGRLVGDTTPETRCLP